MPSLAEVQRRFARAVLAGETEPVVPLLIGGAGPRARLEIHRRHYEASLTTALTQKFPATAWLIGAGALAAAARAYLSTHPPAAPCVAEYGAGFPEFVAARAPAELPYLASFATLEWQVGQASIAVDREQLAWSTVANRGAHSLLDAHLVLQPGLRYLRSAWRVDELLGAYLGGSAPETFVLSTEAAPLEVRGARGAVSIACLAEGTYEFRCALASGRSIGDSAERALERDGSFDAGRALHDLVGAGLATALE
jgi:putative DNA-binding protein